MTDEERVESLAQWLLVFVVVCGFIQLGTWVFVAGRFFWATVSVMGCK